MKRSLFFYQPAVNVCGNEIAFVMEKFEWIWNFIVIGCIDFVISYGNFR